MRLSSVVVGSAEGSLRGSIPVLPPSGSVREIAATERPLGLARWSKHEREFSNRGWTNECNGVATDGTSWFFTSNQEPARPVTATAFPTGAASARLAPWLTATQQPGVFQTEADGRVARHHHIERSLAGHVGDLDLFEGRLYVALEKPTGLMVLDADLNRLDYRRIHTPDGHTFAWCSIHPWNGLLYTCDWVGAATAYAFDRTTAERRRDADISLSRTIDRVQGGAFSPTGQLFLGTDDEAHAGVHAYSASTGAHLDHLPVEVHHGAPKFEEVEGMCFGPRRLGGAERVIHVVLLDMDPIATGDDIFLKSYGSSPS